MLSDSIKARIDRIAELPAENASKSRDFGRGYAQAIRDVIEIIEQIAAETAGDCTDGR